MSRHRVRDGLVCSPLGTTVSISNISGRLTPSRVRARSLHLSLGLTVLAALDSAHRIGAKLANAEPGRGLAGDAARRPEPRRERSSRRAEAGQTHGAADRAETAAGHAASRWPEAVSTPPGSATFVIPTPLNGNLVATSATRLGLTVHETPASVDIVTQQQMREQGYRTTTETAIGAVGVLAGDVGGAPASFSMRGFTFGEVNVLYNGIWIGPGDITSRIMDTANLEQVEFLKGPSAIMTRPRRDRRLRQFRVASSRPRARSRASWIPRSIRSAPTARISARAAAPRCRGSTIVST